MTAMKRLLMVSIFLCSVVSAKASTTAIEDPISGSFHYYSNRTMYSCNFLNWRVQQIMSDLGIVGFSTSCRGGLDDRSPFLSLNYHFYLPDYQDLPHQTVVRFNEYSFNDSWGGSPAGCDLTVQFFRQLFLRIPADNGRYRLNNIFDACWGSQGSFEVAIEIL